MASQTTNNRNRAHPQQLPLPVATEPLVRSGLKKVADRLIRLEGVQWKLLRQQKQLASVLEGVRESLQRLPAEEDEQWKTELAEIAKQVSVLAESHVDSALADALTAELDRYREDWVFQQFQSRVYRDLLALQERLAELKRWAEGAQSYLARERVLENVSSLLAEVTQVMRRQGLSIEPIEVGAEFDPDRHEAVGTRAVEPGKAGRVVEVVRPLVMHDNRVFREAAVVVGTNHTSEAEVNNGG